MNKLMVEMEVIEDQEYDVILHAKLDGTMIPAHRNVLSSSSSFFEAMFSSGMKEANEEEITLDDIPGLMLIEVVKYCYTGQLTTKNMEILAEASDFFQLNGEAALENCLSLMSKNLCVENCMNFVLIAEKHGLKKFLISSMEFIDLFFFSLCQFDAFDDISVQTLESILKRNTLEVSDEKLVFDAILKWYKHDKLNRKKHLPDLMKLVHFSDLDRKFIASFFLDFCSEHDCSDVVAAASEFLAQDDNILTKRGNHRMSDKIVAFNDRTIKVFSEKTKTWSPLTYVECAKSKALAFEDRYLDGIVYYCPVYEDGYLSSLRKTKLTTRETVFEKRVLCANTKVKDAKWIEGDNSMLYLLGYNRGFYDDISFSCDRPVLSCFQFNLEQNDTLWTTLPPIIQVTRCFHIVCVDIYLYVLGAVKLTDFHREEWNDIIPISRFNYLIHVWERCRSTKGNPNEYGVGVVNGCIYVIDGASFRGSAQRVSCYNPESGSWNYVTALDLPCKNMKVCGTNKFLYVVEGEMEPSQTCKRVLRYDPREDQWKELDALYEVNGDFSLVNASNF